MKRFVGLFFAVAFVIALGSPVFGIAEVGVGVMTGSGPLLDVGSPAIELHALLDVACFGIGADVWMSLTGDKFVLFPYVQLQVPLIVAKLYGALGPEFLGSSGSLTLLPLTSTLLTKLGLSITPIPILGFYGEVIWGISPLLMTASDPAFAFGVKLGI